jgi:hypothetical protein
MLGRKSSEFDEILKRYFPRSKSDEIKAARDRFLLLVKERRTLQEALDNFRSSKLVPDVTKYVALGYVDQLVLTTVYLMRGEGTSLRIDEKVSDLTSHIVDTGAVFISLDRLERGKLISSKPVKVEGYDEPQLVFSVTAEGKRMLSAVKTGAKQLVEALADFE